MGLQASFEEYGFPVLPLETLPTNEPAYVDEVGKLIAGTANDWADEQYNLLKSSRIVYLRRIFYITAGTIDFAPPPDKAYAFEAGGMFDAAAADARLLPLISAD
jgi:hypothetical protein